ncbi:hypothetical protein AGMMS49992_19240 [Clostridia bacterium]|nr:hypothetical protein AGMMS49992_19240 [Clostridia bacterium]
MVVKTKCARNGAKKTAVLRHAWIHNDHTNETVASTRRLINGFIPNANTVDGEPSDEIRKVYEDLALEEGFRRLATNNLNHAITFLILVRGWSCSDFCEKTHQSKTAFYNIIHNEAPRPKLDSLLCIIFGTDCGGIIGIQLIELSHVMLISIPPICIKLMFLYRHHSVYEVDYIIRAHGANSICEDEYPVE